MFVQILSALRLYRENSRGAEYGSTRMPSAADRQDTRGVIVAIIGSPTRTNLLLAHAWQEAGVDARVLWPHEALATLCEADVALLRLDVLPTLDGVEPGLDAVPQLRDRGVRILNHPRALLATHDKLLTAERLTLSGVPHPWTRHVHSESDARDIVLPCVLKPRYGSWGQDVFRCRTPDELEDTLRRVRDRSWFERHGALAQGLVEPVRRDLRVIVAGERVVAAAQRRAATGEWRTNVSLGGHVSRIRLPAAARALALRAAAATGIDLAGVDLLPAGSDWIVLELNGAVDFDRRYALARVDPYDAILEALGIADAASHRHDEERKEPMTKTVQGKPPRPGDEIVITGHAVGDAPRTALILDVLGEPGRERYHVRWEDGHESIFFPADDAVIRRPSRRRTTT
jgi:RimK family alpha-L-glutamate ligase